MSLDLLSLIIAGLALLVSIIALTISRDKLTKAEARNLILTGTLENQISERITRTKERVADIANSMAPLLAKKQLGSIAEEEVLILESNEKIFRSAIENNINAYEDACSKYLDGKVDKTRFKKGFHAEIRQLVENQNYKPYFAPPSTRFKAIIKVYSEWYDLED
jgi:hypothetical protein